MSWKGSLIKAGISSDGSNIELFRGNLTLNSDKRVYWRDTGCYIYSNADGYLTIEADTGVVIAADLTLTGTITYTGTITITGGLIADGTTYGISVSTATTGITLPGAYTDAITIGGTASDNSIEITGVAQGAGILIDYTLPTADSRAIHIDTDTAATSGNHECFVLAHTNSAAGINNLRAFTSDLTMGANCNGPYAGYFRTDIGDATVGGLSAAMGMELILSSVSGANGEAHGMTIDIACPDATSAAGTATNKHSFIKLEIWGNTTAKNNFDDQWNLFFFNGLTAGAGSLISEDTQTLRFNISGTSYYLPISTAENCLTFNGSVTDHIVISGTATDNAIEITGVAQGAGILIDYTIPTADSRSIHIDTDTAATSGDHECFVLAHTNSAAGINNLRAFTSDLTMGAGCNGPYAGYFRTDCVTYQVGGLGAALGTEVCLPGATCTSGEFHNITLDFECPTSFAYGAGKHSFIKLEIWGQTTPKNNFDDYFNVFFLNGMTSGAGNLVSANEQTLRINIEGTSRYLMLSHAEDCLTLSGAMTDAIVISGTTTDNAIEITGVAQGAGILVDYTIPTADSRAIHIDTDTAATSGDHECFVLAHTNSAAGINNLRAFTSDLVMGAQCAGPYAGYFRTDCVSYQVTGLCSALGVEVCLPGTTITSGEFHGITIDFECAASGAGFGSGSGKHSFIKCEIWGDTTAKNNFDDGFNLFYINNCTAGSGSLFNTDPTGTCEIEAALRIYVDDTPYWIALMDTYNGA